MAKIDVYLRSIERFGAAGAVLTSGQSVTLRFPAGDRSATQVTAHDQLVIMVREIAPPAALDQIDGNKPARFEFESNGILYTITVTPKPNLWQVAIDGPALAATAATSAPAAAAPARPQRAATAPAGGDGELAIERGQYDGGAPTVAAPATSGSPFLDALTHAARALRATDVYLATGTVPIVRVAGELRPLENRPASDAETLSRELGAVAPDEARGAWTEHGTATFAYGDGMGRVRATLSRDHRGPGAALRVLVPEPPALDRLGLPLEVGTWLDQRGLVVVAGTSGSGKTTTLAALVRALGERGRRVITFEDPIELVQAASPWISQRALGSHIASISVGIGAAVREGADAIVVGVVSSPEHALAVVEAVASGHLVVAGVPTAARHAAAHVVELLPSDRRGFGKAVVDHGFLGAVAATVQGGNRRFEVVARAD